MTGFAGPAICMVPTVGRSGLARTRLRRLGRAAFSGKHLAALYPRMTGFAGTGIVGVSIPGHRWPSRTVWLCGAPGLSLCSR